MSENNNSKTNDQEPVVVLTIAGSDSSGGAGIQADLKTFMAHGVYGASVLTVVTAQNTIGVQAVDVVRPEIVEAQLGSVLSDFTVRAIKIGMVGSADNVAVIACALKTHQNQLVVLDTPLISGTGCSLGSDLVRNALVSELFPLAMVVTPNLQEAALFLDVEPARNVEEMIAQASALRALGARAVLLKGGHLPEFSGEMEQGEALDVLDMGLGPIVLSEKWVKVDHTHGTGCSLASAITAFLAKGEDLDQAVRLAKAWLTSCLDKSSAMGIGSGSGPLHIS